jgi:hypothetical protein
MIYEFSEQNYLVYEQQVKMQLNDIRYDSIVKRRLYKDPQDEEREGKRLKLKYSIIERFKIV